MSNENLDPREVQLSDIMYAIGMESREAFHHMKMLCHELRVPYPPQRIEPVLIKVHTGETHEHSNIDFRV